MLRWSSKLIYLFLTLFALFFIIFAIWVTKLHSDLSSRVEGQWFLPPVEYYTSSPLIKVGQNFDKQSFIVDLNTQGYRSRNPNQKIRKGDWSIWGRELCQENMSTELNEFTAECLIYYPQNDSPVAEESIKFIGISHDQIITELHRGSPFQKVEFITQSPQLFAQFYGNDPILRNIVNIGEIPLSCLQATTAIEDSEFLDHHGISPSGLVRALIKNILKGRYAQGGSTITQQLIKVYFLNSKKTLKRKITELIMAILLELQIPKDKILNNYLNAIYMGQNGPFQVVGFGSASKHYFDKSLNELNLAECALLAAIINSPGRYNPFNHPESSLKRRSLVLNKMIELNMITNEQFNEALQQPLPTVQPSTLSEPSPYFIQGVSKQLEKLGIDTSQGARIFTTLNLQNQTSAKQAIIENLNLIESNNSKIKSLAEKGNHLQSSLVSIDVETGHVMSLVGGRNYQQSQFNRAIDGHRQVGSIMKPFVYLAALESKTSDGIPYHPLTPISDDPLNYKYEGQTWSPSNYENKFHGKLPMFIALKNSINVATARLGITVGLESVIDVARRAGVTSEILALPSITLGAFELYPLEVAQSYLTIARMGDYNEISLIERVEDLSKNKIFEYQPKSEPRFAPENIAVLIGMLKQTILSGTARSLNWRGFKDPAAGKTGTTSDSKDSWFVGFTPTTLTVVWVGYDDNTTHGLTGSSGALPIWASYMNKISHTQTHQDFNWPPGTEQKEYTLEQLNNILDDPEIGFAQSFQLIFRQGEAP